MESAKDAVFCDFCKEPFQRKAKPAGQAVKPAAAPPDVEALKKLTKDELLKLPADQLLKEKEELPQAPPWLRPVAWGFLALWLGAGAMALVALYQRYRSTPPPSAIPEPVIYQSPR